MVAVIGLNGLVDNGIDGMKKAAYRRFILVTA